MAHSQIDPSKESENGAVPVHIAVIMDGNGRWAKSRSKPRHAGHRAGVKSVRQTVELAVQKGVSHLTLFAFSSENWQRPAEEVSRLMGLFLEALQREVDSLHRKNVQLSFIGSRDKLHGNLIKKIVAAEDRTRNNSGLKLMVAVAYGGRWDIINATKSLARKVVASQLAIDEISDDDFSAQLALANVPDPDLLIRTGGEQRISNFLLWNLAYAVLWFPDCLWPDFDAQHFDAALAHFASRQRRYGHTGEQVV